MRPIALFFRLFVWFSWRHFMKHRVRALIVVAGIALGASVFTSVRLSVHASLNSFTKSIDLITGRSDAVLSLPGGRVPEDLLPAVLQQPEVSHASALMTTYVKAAGDEMEPFLLIGFDPLSDRPFRDWEAQRGTAGSDSPWLGLMADPFTVLLSEPLARRHGWQAGDNLTLAHDRDHAIFRVLGILKPEGLGLAEGGRVALTDVATFQEFSGLHGVVDRIDLKLTAAVSPVSLEELGRQWADLLPEGLQITSPSEAGESGRSMIRAYQLNLSILSFASLFVGMFLVYSLVALNAASRRHELAVMRATGASPGLVFALFLTEGVLLGAGGWLAAIPLSGLLVSYMLRGVSQTISTLFVRVHVDTVFLQPWEVLLSFGVTLLISLLAAVQPAREAMLVEAGEALTTARLQRSRKDSAGKMAGVSLALIGAAVPLSRLPAVAGIPLAGYVAILSLFVGFAMLAPWGLQRFGATVSPMLNRLAGVPATLAGRYVRDSGTRTAISVGALITAVSLFTALVIMVHSFRETVQLWVHQTVSGDLFVAGKLSAVNHFRDPAPERLRKGLLRLTASVEPVRSRRFGLKTGNFDYELDLLDLGSFLRHGRFVWVDGNPKALQSRLIDGEGVLISEVFANRTGLEVGDRYVAQVEHFAVELPVLGIVRDYRTRGGVVFYDRAAFTMRYADPSWSTVRLFFRQRPEDFDAALTALRREIIDRCGSHLEMVAGEELRAAILRIFDETFTVTFVLLLIALSIAALGITTTLAVQVLERLPQFNTMIAVGAAVEQVRSMVFWEALLLITAGEIAGLMCGFLLSYLLIYVVNVQSFGWSFIYSVNWKALAASLPLIVGTALLAALPAIRLIFRQPPAILLRDR
ncbi:MAG: hypothetical protein AMJ54_12175 [Deltaproteobacteria bacterium SG8_13]|nr:MAG: hypothetical protein AMJ54_12175 [Deltaproteobacteria bacterium SG8_13]